MQKPDKNHSGKIGAYTNILLAILRKNPALIQRGNEGVLKAHLVRELPQLKDRGTCVNCGASMAQYIFHFDILDAVLLLKMSQSVESKMKQGLPFNIANRVKVQDLDTGYAVKSRTTQASKLGLIAKYRKDNGRQESGMWLITKRGWEALQGKPVPAKVLVWRNKIAERFPETTTIPDIFKTHKLGVAKANSAGKKPPRDFTDLIGSYNNEWYEVVIRERGNLF